MCFSGKTGALEQIHEISGACHKRFKTEVQAKAFIEDWKESFADLWRREVKQALDRGLRPRDMKVSIDGILHEAGEDNVAEDLEKHLGSVATGIGLIIAVTEMHVTQHTASMRCPRIIGSMQSIVRKCPDDFHTTLEKGLHKDGQ